MDRMKWRLAVWIFLILVIISFIALPGTLSAPGTFLTYLFHLSPMRRARFMRGHAVVCGPGRAGVLIAGTFLIKGTGEPPCR